MENNYNTQLSLKEFEAIVKHATSQPDQVIKTSNILKKQKKHRVCFIFF